MNTLFIYKIWGEGQKKMLKSIDKIIVKTSGKRGNSEKSKRELV